MPDNKTSAVFEREGESEPVQTTRFKPYCISDEVFSVASFLKVYNI